MTPLRLEAELLPFAAFCWTLASGLCNIAISNEVVRANQVTQPQLVTGRRAMSDLLAGSASLHRKLYTDVSSFEMSSGE